MREFALCLLCAPGIVACRTNEPRAASSLASGGGSALGAADLPITTPPYRDVHASFKERLEQPYVCIEHVGDYAQTGPMLAGLDQEMKRQGLTASGPPFILFFDDPARVAKQKLHAQVCFPVDRPYVPAEPLKHDILPTATVVYAVVRGPYPDVQRAYPGLHAFLERMGWIENGPIREIYFVPPGSVKSFDELLCEVQIPATWRP